MNNDWKKEYILKAINYFNNAFADGEDGEELRNEDLAEEYAENMWKKLIKPLLNKQKQEIEGMKKRDLIDMRGDLHIPDKDINYRSGYNQAISDVLTKLKDKTL